MTKNIEITVPAVLRDATSEFIGTRRHGEQSGVTVYSVPEQAWTLYSLSRGSVIEIGYVLRQRQGLKDAEVH